MNAAASMAPVDWRDLNYQMLLGEVDNVKRRLKKRLPDQKDDDGALEAEESPETSVMLDRLCTLFGLSYFERRLILLCVAAELDAEAAALCNEAIQQPLPNLALALSMFDGDCSALAPDAPLRYFKLIKFTSTDASLLRGALTLSQWALLFLVGKPILDPLLKPSLHPLEPIKPMLATHQHAARQVRRAQQVQSDEPAAMQLIAASADDARQVAALIAQKQNQPVYELNLYQLPRRNDEQQDMLRRIERELIAQQSLLLINCERLSHATDSPLDLHPIRNWLDCLHRDLPNAVILYAEKALELPMANVQHHRIAELSDSERLQLWRHCLPERDGREIGSTLMALNSQYHFSGRQVRAIARSVKTEQDSRRLQEKLWSRSREQSRQNLQGMAQVIAPGSLDWDDVILPDKEKNTLYAIVSQTRLRQQVYHQWGFAERLHYGLGIYALFTGTSGTGKTLSARIIASALKLDLYLVDLSSVVDKYIGETEKKLDLIFTAAQNSGAVLLFDEADALFGKRTKVQDSKDRYANMGVSFLLQRMERHAGLSILTTNSRSALDTAFTRRIRFIVQFPFPSETERRKIWRRTLPDKAPTEDIDYQKLGRLTLSGGAISNIVLQAAFTAAEAGRPIRMATLRQAVQQEYIKAEKTLDQKLVADW